MPHNRSIGPSPLALALAAATVAAPLSAMAQKNESFDVSGRVALHAVMSLSDAHLQKMSDVLSLLASLPDVRSGAWTRIRPHLAAAEKVNVPAVLWFATPDGAYWTVTQGRVAASLSDRAYFPRLMAGRNVIGDLVVSRSSNRNTAIVAVPVRGSNGRIVGALGSSIHLDSLAARLREELGGLDRDHLFFALGGDGLGALNSDPTLIFTEPVKLGDPTMQDAFRKMLSSDNGVVTYPFRGSQRTVLYTKSPVTGWRYGFGMLMPKN